MMAPMGQVETRIGPINPTISEKLEGRKRELETELASVNNALDLLAKSPDLKELFDAVTKVRVY